MSYGGLAATVLIVHLAFILWLIFGALLTRGHWFWSWVHILTMLYGIIIEAGPWPCPLTILEQHFEQQTGTGSYQQPFLVHYLEALVYPNVSEIALVWCTAAIFAINLGIYGRRFQNSRKETRP